MGVLTTLLKLLKPGENDYYNQQTEQADNWQKVDDYAVYTDRDKNAIWGGLDGGGLIEDPSVTKVIGKRYIGADGKGYICKVPSDINNSTNYTPCNVVDNLDKLQNLLKVNGTNQNEYKLLTGVIQFQEDIRPGSTYLGGAYFSESFSEPPIVVVSADLAVSSDGKCFVSGSNANTFAFNYRITNVSDNFTYTASGNSVRYYAIGKK